MTLLFLINATRPFWRYFSCSDTLENVLGWGGGICGVKYNSNSIHQEHTYFYPVAAPDEDGCRLARMKEVVIFWEELQEKCLQPSTDLKVASGCRVVGVVVAMCQKAEHTCDLCSQHGNQPLGESKVLFFDGE